MLLLSIIFLESFQSDVLNKKDGAAPGYTGSPGDTLKNCTKCHGGTAVPVLDWIKSDVPKEGYIPGKTYTIIATNAEVGATRFGFEVSPQNIKGDLLGELILTDTFRTKLVGEGKYITYTSNGIEGVNTLSWTFNWIAPQKGTGEVIFYGGFNSNFAGHKDGDKTYLSTLKVKEIGSAGMLQLNKLNGVSVYPNPSSELLNISFSVKTQGIVVIDILDQSGKLITTLLKEKFEIGEINKQFNSSDIKAGNYFVRIVLDGQASTQKLLLIH